MIHPSRARPAPPASAVVQDLYRQRAPFYDMELYGFETLRQACIEKLQLRTGQRVLDLGCGTGLSLPALARAVGPLGRVVGIEQSPEMLAQARQRAAAAGWRQVRLIESPVAQAPLRGRFDAALFHFTHDILQQREALRHVAAHLRPGARVAAVGLAWAHPWSPWAWPSNCFVMGAALYSVESLQGLGAPWHLLRELLPDMQLRANLPGGFYLAWGHMPGG